MASGKGVGIPVKLLHESEGHVVTIELTTGEFFRGELFEAEDNWNCQLRNVTKTAKDGKITHLENIFVRGSKIRWVIVPDMLRQAPMFKRIDPQLKKKAKGAPLGVGTRGQKAVSRARNVAPPGSTNKPPPRR